MSGIDKTFDYLVPASMAPNVSIGDRVRVNLHGRRVGGWIIALGEWGSDGFSEVSLAKLQPIIKHSGHGVVSELVPLAEEIAHHYLGPRRAVLQSASAPKVTRSRGGTRSGSVQVPHDSVADLVAAPLSGVHVMRIAPLDSVLSLVLGLADKGPVLVVCPTVRMAVLGAASLRRRGCVVALAPDDWDQCLDGVDVVIGARSAVWAPCPRLSAIVVVDEHDDGLKEERVPTWHAREVALRRANNAKVPCILCSPVPSVQASHLVHIGEAREATATNVKGWPRIDVADLSEVPVASSLATSEMLEMIRRPSASVLCVLNTKGGARLLACGSCHAIARCRRCSSVLESDDSAMFKCRLCGDTSEAVCEACGRTSFRILRSGISRLRDQMAQSSGREVIEVDSSVDVLEQVGTDAVYIGTEALLHRVSSADHVVFLDFDSEVLAPRAGAGRDALALLVRASRIVGTSGSILIQTRHRDHDLVHALSLVHNDVEALRRWEERDSEMRKMLSLPPYSAVARVRLDLSIEPSEVFSDQRVSWAREKEHIFMVRAADRNVLHESLLAVRATHGGLVRVDLDPIRY